MKSINDQLDDLFAAIWQDTATDAWSNLHYGRAHQVLRGWNLEDLPGEDDCPVVAIMPAEQTRGRTSRRQEHGYDLYCCVYDTGRAQGVATNAWEYAGIRRVEELRALAQDAMAAVDLGNAVIDTVESAYEPMEFFPLIMAYSHIVIRDEFVQGDPLS